MKKALIIATETVGGILIRGLPEGWESSLVAPKVVIHPGAEDPSLEESLAGKDLVIISDISIDVISAILEAVDQFLPDRWPLIACSTSGEVYPEHVPPRCNPVFIHDITPGDVQTALGYFDLSAPVLTAE